MAKKRSLGAGTGSGASKNSRGRVPAVTVILALATIAAMVWAVNSRSPSPAHAPSHATPSPSPATRTEATTPSIEVNQAVMVTVELDFGGSPTSIAEALNQVERRHEADAGQGRVFAILDAYGEPTPDGKKLHMSMHVSTERPGIGSLVFKRTGETLWRSRVVAATNAHDSFAGNALTILLDDGSGRLLTVDGSKNPASILEATIKELGQPVSEVWKEGAEHELTFIYSACGCPVKVMCRRSGDLTVRTKELPVIFPDDPAVVGLIRQLMRW